MIFLFHDATFRAGGKLVLENTSWTVEEGEHWAVCGPTGAGKTLLSRAICRELPLYRGEMRYRFTPQDGPEGCAFPRPGDIQVFSAEAHRDFMRRYMDYAQGRYQSFENEGIPTTAQVLKAEPGALRVQGPRRRAKPGLRARLIAEFGLAELLRRPVHLLSNGESRKVFLARLLLRSPRLLILDDPYVGLDAGTRAGLARAIEQMLTEGDPALIFLTARPEDIPAGVERVLLLRDCRTAGVTDRAGARAAAAETQRETALSPAFLQAAARYEDALRAAAQPGTEIIAMRGVTVDYGAARVLAGVDWTMRAGERWALLGPNGAGKSTLLSLVLGDHPQAYANDIRLFGRKRGSGESIWEIKARQGWVAPELQIHFPRAMSSLDVVCSGYFDSVGLFRRPSAEQMERARAWLLALDCADAGSSFAALSAGQQRGVLLARALVKHPPLLVLDEPLQGLDLAHRRRMLELVDRLCAHSSLSLVYISHYADEIPGAITHRLQLEKGRVTACGRKH